MITTTTPKHLLRVSDLGAGELERLLDIAAQMKADPLGWRSAQAGKVLACFFSKPSTRTRVSLEAAAQRLGMLPLMLRPDELQLGRGEPIADTGRVLSSYYGTPTARPLHSATPVELAELDLPAGSMGPKADAARRFVERGGRLAAIASLSNARAALDGEAGTTVRTSRSRATVR
jgi:Aspartate/ornithine carbamoyltransferase, carbamoyl-P binding domain